MQPGTSTVRATLALMTGVALACLPLTGAGADAPRSNSDVAPLMSSGANIVENQYIVVLEDDAPARAVTSVAATVTAAGGEVLREYTHAIDGLAVMLPGNALTAVRNDPNVAFVETDATVSINTTQSPATWGIDRTDQRNLPLDNAYTYNATGAGVTAFVIDTGIRNSHTEFGGRAVSGFDAIGDGQGTNDCNGHGTHVSGTIGGATYGIAKNVTLVAVRVLDCGGSGTIAGVIAGVDWVTGVHSGPSVANMSLGGGYSPALNASVDGSISSGVTYAVAAGNSYGADACGSSPSGVPAAITVGSSTRDDVVSDFSNLGPCLDIFGPGSNITSAWPSSDTDTNTISGTSMATPHVAGVAALYLEWNPAAGPGQVASDLSANGTGGVLAGVPGDTVNLLLFSNY